VHFLSASANENMERLVNNTVRFGV
jgi:hypothetical protein